MDNDKDLQSFVEDKIMRITFRAKNFSKEEMDRVDKYCKLHFGNDRKKMVLGLITMMENNTMIDTLNKRMDGITDAIGQELNNIYNILNHKEDKKEEPDKEEPKKKKVSWKGFTN